MSGWRNVFAGNVRTLGTVAMTSPSVTTAPVIARSRQCPASNGAHVRARGSRMMKMDP